MLSPEMEDYLKVIYDLQRSGADPVSTSEIADTLAVTPPTATSMMEKLADRELVEREKYKGVTLTTEGETVALEVVRHHRLIETYLAERLGYSWAEVHDEADRLEHHISEEFERRVADVLDDPQVDPHGDPIPNDALDPMDDAEGATLADFEEDDRVVVRRVRDRDPDGLAYLQGAGITPGTVLTVTEVAPIGMVTVSLPDGETTALPQRVAETIRVEAAGATEDAAAP
ncbi:MAG: DtxR family Mn-dependent transcriptional regulator [Salinirussus sp.]|jgi:DtxR family Mn-dependent transcriptional regulator